MGRRRGGVCARAVGASVHGELRTELLASRPRLRGVYRRWVYGVQLSRSCRADVYLRCSLLACRPAATPRRRRSPRRPAAAAPDPSPWSTGASHRSPRAEDGPPCFRTLYKRLLFLDLHTILKIHTILVWSYRLIPCGVNEPDYGALTRLPDISLLEISTYRTGLEPSALGELLVDLQLSPSHPLLIPISYSHWTVWSRSTARLLGPLGC
ncbi:unnamed protein product [Plutella xylostella]|uniref:(diamondback moth) hypothetical protein n=1 Tax=Plutella xylostella TaxID=51655 RepID=A0A8S4DRI7_PLUXY|nr:unnamed protein product [Plutella xylostella]